jgi:hypothetical protein
VLGIENVFPQLVIWGNDYPSLCVPKFESGDCGGGTQLEVMLSFPFQDEV